MKEKQERTRAEVALCAAAKAAMYQLLGDRIESAGVTGAIVDNESPVLFHEFVSLVGKVKFRLEKAIIIYTATIWARDVFSTRSKSGNSSNLQDIIFNSIGGFSAYRNLLQLPKDVGLMASALLVREMDIEETANRYCKQLAENHMSFLIRQTLILLDQPAVAKAVRRLEKALTGKSILTGEEIREICSECHDFQVLAELGLIYAGAEFRRTALK